MMNPRKLVKLSNMIGIVSILMLVYWVFVFISIEVFGFKVFRENLTETFYLSVLGILALMAGALIINVMFNLTRIAQKHNQDEQIISNRKSKWLSWAFVLTFPIIFGFLMTGDYLTSKKKERLLVRSAESIIADNEQKVQQLMDYRFTEEWIIETESLLNVISKTDEHFPSVSIIHLDSIGDTPSYLRFHSYYAGRLNDETLPEKKDFILRTSQQERDYLKGIYEGKHADIRFSAHDGNYELFYPHVKGEKKMVIYFSDYQRFGKIGS